MNNIEYRPNGCDAAASRVIPRFVSRNVLCVCHRITPLEISVARRSAIRRAIPFRLLLEQQNILFMHFFLLRVRVIRTS